MAGDDRLMEFGVGDRKLSITVMPVVEEFGLIGIVESKWLPGRIAIRQDDTPDDDRNYNIGALHTIKQRSDAVISLEPDICAALRNGEPLALFTVFHELGHYVYGHKQRRVGSKEDIEEKRKELVMQGSVLPDELEADVFAAKYLGIDKAIEGLCTLRQYIVNRYQPAEWDAEDFAVMIREIEIRIDKLKRFVLVNNLEDNLL